MKDEASEYIRGTIKREKKEIINNKLTKEKLEVNRKLRIEESETFTEINKLNKKISLSIMFIVTFSIINLISLFFYLPIPYPMLYYVLPICYIIYIQKRIIKKVYDLRQIERNKF